MKVREIMTSDVECCTTEDDCGEAIRIMWDNDCGIVPVVDADRRVVGAITDRDIAIACWSRNAGPREIRIEDTMSRDVKCCRREDTVTAAEELMEKCQVRRLPVIDKKDRLCGILSLADITRIADIRRGNGSASADLRPEKVVEAYAAVCHPRSDRLH
jgi:CBS domain-containing protein